MIIFAIASRKGGTGKSTTAVNLAAALARRYETLLIDLDPQGQASVSLGISPDSLPFSVYDLLLGEVTLDDTVWATPVPRLRIVPADGALARAEHELATVVDGEARLRTVLEGLEGVDYVVIDCPPGDGWLTLNAMVAADQVILPMPGHYMAIDALAQQVQAMDRIRAEFNPALQIAGVLPTMVDLRSQVTASVLQVVRNNYGHNALLPTIHYDTNVSDAPCFHLPVTHYMPNSSGARDYQCLADILARRCPSVAPVAPAPVAQWAVRAA